MHGTGGIGLATLLLAKALGGSVARNEQREIGWYDVELTAAGREDPVLEAFSARQQGFQWHEDGKSLPPNVVRLAGSEISAVQAFRHGEHAYGFQFHLEADGALIERWLNVPQHLPVFESGEIDPAHIRARIDAAIDPLMSLSNSTFGQWVDRFDLQPRRRHLPSR